MVPSRSFPFFVFTLVSYYCSLASSAPWIVTDYYVAEPYTHNEGYTDAYTTQTPDVETDIIQVTPTAFPVPTPLSTTTWLRSDSYDGVVTMVQVLLPSGAGAPSTVNYDDYYDPITTDYYVNLVFTAPTSCSSQWTATTAVPIQVPYMLEGVVKATSVSTSYSVDNGEPFQPTTITQAMAYIDPTQLPASSLSQLSEYYSPVSMYRYQESGCSYYYNGAANSDSISDGNYNGGYDNWLYYDDGYGLSPLGIILVCVLGWFGLWLIIGLIESWFNFRRLMKGWQARRGLPISWCMLAPIVSLLLLFFSRKGFQARMEEEAEDLEKKWGEIGFWKRIGLWLRWGFSWKYPPVLGPAPPRVGRPNKRPIPVTPLLHVSPSRSVASQSGPPSGNGDLENLPLQREMSQRRSQQQQQTLQVPSPGLRVPQQPSPSPDLPSQSPATAPETGPAAPNQQDDEITVIPATKDLQQR